MSYQAHACGDRIFYEPKHMNMTYNEVMYLYKYVRYVFHRSHCKFNSEVLRKECIIKVEHTPTQTDPKLSSPTISLQIHFGHKHYF